jgi:hypothetical protein
MIDSNRVAERHELRRRILKAVIGHGDALIVAIKQVKRFNRQIEFKVRAPRTSDELIGDL